MKANLIILIVEKVWLRRYYIWFGGWFFKTYILLCNAWHNPLNPLYHCPQLSERFSVRCNEAVFSTLLHDEINLDEAKGSNQVPLRDFMVPNDYFSDDFYKDFEVTSKHLYRRHIFLVWLKVLNWSSSFCARPCLLGVHVNAWCGVVVALQ